MGGGNKGETSKRRKSKGKSPVVRVDEDESMEEAEAHDLGASQEIVRNVQGQQEQQQLQEQELQDPHPNDLLELDPSTLWFDVRPVKNVLSDSLTGYYVQPWRNYGEVDEDSREHFWNLFNKKFKWAPELNNQVKDTFEEKFANRLRDTFYNITHRLNGRKPRWLNKDVHEGMMKIIATDPKYQKRSEQNKKNRRGGSMENVVEPTHFQGSMSSVQHAKKMAAKNQGQLPNAHDIFLKTHFKEVPGKGQVAANNKAKRIADTYQKKLEETMSQGIQKSPNELYWESVGGRNKKGRVKGLGQSAELYYGKQGRGSRSSQQYTPSVICQMQDQMEHRMQTLQTQMEARIAEMERRYKESFDEMMSRLNNNDSCSTIHPQHRDPRNDPGGGGAG
ncbi:uncharacterized protein LOC110711054 [Chenopodium quinoa]|uniref:uncharacterized protein LOC110711054 n=1 Tax=Chenopodium quinoa TaxID=63459 RepID=UPI000B792169|nr:uncharacterized protein LOC110711054 [Chenopodium quinoa]